MSGSTEIMSGSTKSARELLGERIDRDKQLVALRVDGRIYDLHTPVPVGDDPKVQGVRADEDAGLAIIRHSTAHVMADAVQRLFPGTKVTIGPSTANGFYYDFDKPGDAFSDADLETIEKSMAEIVAGKHPFVREEVTRDEAHKLFDSMGETYKRELIDAIPEGETISLYRHGDDASNWVDLCQGPHVPHTGLLKAIKLTSVAGAYWRGDESNAMLQRIYGTAFAKPADLRKHLNRIEEAKKRDHRKLGKELELFMFHEWAPAMPFFLPRGAFVYTRLVNFMRGLYERYGYDEVITPQVFDKRLFETSGHLPNYRENMYMAATADDLDGALGGGNDKDADAARAKSDVERFGQKPMNCPSHCLIFGAKRRSYRELPMRIADFCRLHRYERGGVVHGLARVRSFAQDDAHIFCTPEQMVDELQNFVKLLYEVYEALQFTRVDIKLATRPKKRIGTDAQWDAAESALADALNALELDYELAPEEGAFYGPKLEFHIHDALERSWQLGTIQVDYALPDRFNLNYTGPDGQAHRPVMLHRAILGSLERFLALYIEHTAGKFPMWLAPEQVTLATVTDNQSDFAYAAAARLRQRGLRVKVDASPDKLGAKIRKARLERVPYIGVIGEKEVAGDLVSPRSRDLNKNLEPMSLDAFADKLVAEARPPAAKAQPNPNDGAAPAQSD
jgi:threonyl-tRNA synthetase